MGSNEAAPAIVVLVNRGWNLDTGPVLESEGIGCFGFH